VGRAKITSDWKKNNEIVHFNADEVWQALKVLSNVERKKKVEMYSHVKNRSCGLANQIQSFTAWVLIQCLHYFPYSIKHKVF